MPSNYQVLNASTLPAGTSFCRPRQEFSQSVTLESPATEVMTDLRKVTAITIQPGASLDEANNRMILMGVRLLFVTDHKEQIIGLITARDIQGEKPLQLQQQNGLSRDEICVLDIMTGLDEIETVTMHEVEMSRVGDIVVTLKQASRQHTLVMEEMSGQYRVRGLFSTSQISKQLGIQVENTQIAQTFAELEKVLIAS